MSNIGYVQDVTGNSENPGPHKPLTQGEVSTVALPYVKDGIKTQKSRKLFLKSSPALGDLALVGAKLAKL